MKKYIKSSTYEQRVYNRIMENEVSSKVVVDFFIHEVVMLMGDNNMSLQDAISEVKSTAVPEILNQVDEFLISSGLVGDKGELRYELLD